MLLCCVVCSLHQAEPPTEAISPTPVVVSYDMGWQKRSSGRRYDSLSGVGAIVGSKTKKILSYGVKQKDCRKCTYYKEKNKPVPPHRCFRNHSGSSKSMESALASELLTKMERDDNVIVQQIIMDDDSTTFSRISNDLGHKVEKICDIKHTMNAVQSALYKIKNKELTKDTIKYVMKCISYAIVQNKDNPVSLTRALQSIVPHAFGDHSMCGDWCSYLRNPAEFKHRSLPGGKDLHCCNLKSQLQSIINNLILEVKSIAPCGSTNINENFNHMVSSKAPKARHYSSTGSLQVRVASAVSEKNIGSTYLCDVHQKCGISPGTVCNNFAKRLDKIRKRTNSYKTSISYKRRKLQSRLAGSQTRCAVELREGATYESRIDFTPSISDQDITCIPPPIDEPLYSSIPESSLQSATKV